MDKATQGQLEALAGAIAALEARSDAFETVVGDLTDRADARADATGAALDRTKERLDLLTEGIASCIDRLDGLDALVAETRQATALGIEKVERAEMRIKATVQRAQKKLADSGVSDPSLDTEVEQLRLIDGNGSDIAPVPTLPTRVETPATRHESMVEQLRALGLSE